MACMINKGNQLGLSQIIDIVNAFLLFYTSVANNFSFTLSKLFISTEFELNMSFSIETPKMAANSDKSSIGKWGRWHIHYCSSSNIHIVYKLDNFIPRMLALTGWCSDKQAIEMAIQPLRTDECVIFRSTTTYLLCDIKLFWCESMKHRLRSLSEVSWMVQLKGSVPLRQRVSRTKTVQHKITSKNTQLITTK